MIQDLIEEENLDLEDNLLILLPTCPLRVTSDLYECIKVFESNNRNGSVMTVTQHTHPPELSWSIKNNKLLPFNISRFKKGKLFSRKQNYTQRYYFDEAILLDKVAAWTENSRTLFGKDPLPILTSPERGIPIDYPIHLCSLLT